MKPYLLSPVRRLSTHAVLRASLSPGDLLPPDLQINTVLPLANTAPPYNKHVIISTGHSNWCSQIVAETGPNLAKDLKGLLGLGGEFHNELHKVLITNSAFRSLDTGVTDCRTTSAYLFPSFQHVQGIPMSKTGVRAFAREFLVPGNDSTETPSSDTQNISSKQEDIPDSITKDASSSISSLYKVSSVSQPIVLICGHMERDKRCGIYGPILLEEFNKHLPPTANPTATLVSHIGGHRFAGNVIIYIPPDFLPTLGRFAPSSADMVNKEKHSTPHKLAGSGIWYGRVEPESVEQIVNETILGGRIVGKHFRGGIDKHGRSLLLP
ncbi:hypothetical protein MMC31_005562 [Peltigera leucophlebia]|nr:hypothetical protein [Peltigera leucophlebia]